MNKWRCLLIAACMILGSTPAMAALLRGTQPSADSVPKWVISSVDISKRTIVINDTVYRLGAAVKVHTAAHRHGSLRDLRRGMQVGYRLENNRDGQAVITEIWEGREDGEDAEDGEGGRDDAHHQRTR